MVKNDSHEWHPYIHQYGYYDPVTAGSIDGTDTIPHDRAVHRALSSSYKPKCQMHNWNPKAIIFIGRLPYYTTEICLQKALNKLLTMHRKEKQSFRRRNRSRSPFASDKHDDSDEEGDADDIWPKVNIVHNVVTGYPCGYAFAHFASEVDADRVLRNWYSQTATDTNTTSTTTSNTSHRRIRNDKHCGLDIPNGEKVILEPYFSGTLPGWRPRRLGGGLGGRKEAGQLRFGGIARPFRRPILTSIRQ
ncbi:unnamed protein product [Trichobilharzia szidati]|nr:unnamed protein product [Trichobilharzia szidati]